MSISGSNAKLLTLKSKHPHAIAIVGDKVIYYETAINAPSSRRCLYSYSLTDNVEQKIAEIEEAPTEGVAIRDNMIAWPDGHAGRYDIYYYDFLIKTGGKLINQQSSKVCPYFYKNYVFWSDKKNDSTTDYDIYVKNLITGTVKAVVTRPGRQLYPVYFNGFLYWTNYISSPLADGCLAGNDQSYVIRKRIDLPR